MIFKKSKLDQSILNTVYLPLLINIYYISQNNLSTTFAVCTVALKAALNESFGHRGATEQP